MKQPESQATLYGGSGNRAVALVIDVTLLVFLASVLSGLGPLGGLRFLFLLSST